MRLREWGLGSFWSQSIELHSGTMINGQQQSRKTVGSSSVASGEEVAEVENGNW